MCNVILLHVTILTLQYITIKCRIGVARGTLNFNGENVKNKLDNF